MISPKEHMDCSKTGIIRLLLTALAVLCVISSQPALSQTSKQELWNNIDLLDPNVKVLSKASRKKREMPFVKGGSKVLIPIGGAALVGTGIYYLANRENNDCPDTKANSDILSLDCGGTNTIDLFANDGGDDLVLESIDLSNLPMNMDAQVGEGVITLSGSSEDSFEIPYSILDECGNVDSSIIEVVFEGLPDLNPIPDDLEAFTDQSTTFFVLNNDEGLNLSLVSAIAESGSSASISNNTIVYTPVNDSLEDDILHYEIIDDCGQTASSTATVTFINDSDVQAVDDFLDTNCNSTVSFNVLSNDIGENLRLILVSGAPSDIILNFDESGFITINGITTNSFTFDYLVENDEGVSSNGTVSINVVASEILALDDNYFTEGNQTLLFDPTGNDEGFIFTITDVVQPTEGGQVISSQNGNELSFAPTPGFSGQVTFTYTITDNCAQTATATVEITVGDLSDVFANDDFFTADCNQPLTMDVISNDMGEEFEVISIGNSSGVDLVINDDSSISAGNVGNASFSFQYTISNSDNVTAVGNVNVAVNASSLQTNTDTLYTTATNPVTVNPLLNDIGSNLSISNYTESTNGGTLSLDGNQLTYTPPIGFTGETMFTYTASDDCGSADGLVVVIVQPDSSDIIANNDSFLLPCNPNADLDLLSNDLGNGISITNISSVPGVILLLQGDGTVHIEGNGISSFSFQYTISDSAGNSSIANVNININQSQINVGNDSYTTNYETSINLPVLSNDSGDALSIVGFSQAAGGTLTLNADNTFTFVPDAGYSGSTQFDYNLSDACGQSAQANVTILVLQSPDAVTASDDNVQLSCNPNNIIDVLQNDTGAGLSIISIDNQSNADVSIDPSGLQIQIIGNNLNTFSFNYTIQGSGGFTDEASVIVNITLPQISAVDETFSSAPNTSVSVDVLQNDLGQGLTIIDYDESASGGTLSIQTDGTFLFVPNPGFSGNTSFQYTVEDECGQVDTATLIFIVDSLPDIQAIDDNILADCNSFISYNLLANDLGQNLSITSINNTSSVTITDNGNGNINIANVGTTDFQFSYDIGNNFGQTASAVVNVEIVLPDLFIVDDSYTTDYETSVLINPLQNDQGNSITILSIGGVTDGTIQDQGNGTLVFTPNDGFSGTTQFSYSIVDACGQQNTANITIEVTDCPIDALGNSFATQTNQSINLDVISDDTGVGLNIIGFSQPANGSVSDLGNNLLEFTPDNDYSGSTSFTYTIENECGISQTATVFINIEDCSISAQDDLYQSTSGTAITIAPLGNDSGSNITITNFQAPAVGLLVDNGNGTLTYTPHDPFCETVSFTYDITNDCGDVATATVTIEPVLSAIELIDDTYTTNANESLVLNPLSNDTGVSLTIVSTSIVQGGNIINLANGQLEFIPDNDFSGTASFSYTAQDACGQTASANVSIEIADCSLMALDDFATTGAGTQITIAPLTNDTGNNVQITSHTNPSSGTLIDNGDGSFTFSAPEPFCEETTFTYVVSNDCNETATATVSISPTNATLFAADDTANTVEDTAVDIDILTNDTYSGSVSFMLAPTMDGTTIVNQDNTITFTPNAGFIGTTVINYDLVDECGQTSSAQITISVGVDTCDIMQVDDAYTVFVGETLDFEPLLNDNGSGLFISSFNQSSNGGTISDLGNNVLSFTSDGSFVGMVQFDVVIENECGDQVIGMVSIEILACTIAAEIEVSNANCGSNNGSITINNITPISNYDVSWSNGATGSTLSNLSAGTFVLTITDLDTPACVFTQSIEVLEEDLILMQQIGGTPATCQSDGNLNIQTVSSTTGPIVIEILLNGNLIDIEQVAAGDPLDYTITAGGTYTLFAYDQSVGSQCAEVVDITLEQETDVLLLENTDTTLPSTGTATDGSVTYAVQNSIGSSWTFDLNGNTFTSSNPSYTFDNLSANNYTLTVTDDNGCTGTLDFALTPIMPLVHNDDHVWKSSRLYQHPDQRRLEQQQLLLPILDLIDSPVEHPLITSADFENGEWVFSEQLHFNIRLAKATSERGNLQFGLNNTSIRASRLIDDKYYLPVQISHFQWTGSYQHYFDRAQNFYGEAGLQLHHFNLSQSGLDKTLNIYQLNPYLQVGAQWRISNSFGLDSNVRWNNFDWSTSDNQTWRPTWQFGLFRTL